jgi:hypothetical protein
MLFLDQRAEIVMNYPAQSTSYQNRVHGRFVKGALASNINSRSIPPTSDVLVCGRNKSAELIQIDVIPSARRLARPSVARTERLWIDAAATTSDRRWRAEPDPSGRAAPDARALLGRLERSGDGLKEIEAVPRQQGRR